MKRFSHQLRIQDARAINANFAAANGRREEQEPNPAAHVAAVGDADRLVRAMKARCLKNYGCFLENGVPVRADGSVVAPGSFVNGRALPETAGLGSHLDSGDTPGSIQQQIDNPDRLLDAVKRRLLASGRTVVAT